VGLGNLTFFAACGGFCDGGGLGAASGFDTLCCGSTRGLFGLAQGTAHGGVGVVSLMGACSLGCMTSGGLCCCGGGLGFGLRKQCLLANLFGSAMPELRAILPAGGGEVAVLCSMKIRPGVENRYIFGGLGSYRFLGLARAARIHIPYSCAFALRCCLTELRRFAASSIRHVCTRYHAIA
jgi:hypothetical protein